MAAWGVIAALRAERLTEAQRLIAAGLILVVMALLAMWVIFVWPVFLDLRSLPVPRQNDVGLMWSRSIARDGTRRGAEAIGSATCGRTSVSGGRKSEGRTVLVCDARIRGSAADYAARRTYR